MRAQDAAGSEIRLWPEMQAFPGLYRASACAHTVTEGSRRPVWMHAASLRLFQAPVAALKAEAAAGRSAQRGG